MSVRQTISSTAQRERWPEGPEGAHHIAAVEAARLDYAPSVSLADSSPASGGAFG